MWIYGRFGTVGLRSSGGEVDDASGSAWITPMTTWGNDMRTGLFSSKGSRIGASLRDRAEVRSYDTITPITLIINKLQDYSPLCICLCYVHALTAAE